MAKQHTRKRFIDYLQEFIHDSKSVGILLLACTLLSLLLANLPATGDVYTKLFSAESEWLHAFHLPSGAGHFINDGLMAVFFFLVGLEIKREMLFGELSSVKQAMLPIGAAIGGMLMPAFIFILCNKGTIYQAGWGIPMATDIAFSLGVASLMGSRFPAGLKVFLTALAIIDDLGAILVIAFFYGGEVKFLWLAIAAGCIFLLALLNKRKAKFGWMHIMLGIALWYCVFNSGIHATIAGVVFAFMIPKEQINHLEHMLHKPVNFIVLPLFALANTAIVLNGSMTASLFTSLSAGIFLGLFLGKPIGVFLACRILVTNKLAKLPDGIRWKQIFGAGILAGIGFTMSIFIAVLAFGDAAMQDVSKLVILLGSVFSILAAFGWMNAISDKVFHDDETDDPMEDDEPILA